ncbi:MAG: phosphopentomutase [Roseobacter sp.]
MTRAFLVVMDSVGIGGAPDAHKFYNAGIPDTGANTLAHIAQACAAGQASTGRDGPLRLPNLDRLGLGAAVKLASGTVAPGLDCVPTGAWGAATEISAGKDTPSGHWELAGLPVPWAWHHFTDLQNSMPQQIIARVCELAGCGNVLGNCHASGTAIIKEHGNEHIRSGSPIIYTSADSVCQIAAHEVHFGLDRLLDLCENLAPMLHDMKVGRVIARPFIGTSENDFRRTANRRDYAITPPAPVVTNWVQDAGREVFAVGKIGDIFSMQGIDQVFKGADMVLMDHLKSLVQSAPDGSLTFANFVEFDSEFGHRRDVAGYARALEWFDREIGTVIDALNHDDILVVTADHGNDPTWHGTDHTRERVPVLISGLKNGALGQIGFTDVAAIIADHLGVAKP